MKKKMSNRDEHRVVFVYFAENKRSFFRTLVFQYKERRPSGPRRETGGGMDLHSHVEKLRGTRAQRRRGWRRRMIWGRDEERRFGWRERRRRRRRESEAHLREKIVDGIREGGAEGADAVEGLGPDGGGAGDPEDAGGAHDQEDVLETLVDGLVEDVRVEGGVQLDKVQDLLPKRE